MTDTLKEQLSAFLDGELPEAETTLLLKRLERDDELKGTLSRYSLIGVALRAEGEVADARNVASRVRVAIAGEPTLSRSPWSRWLRPVAGLAMAAGVAAATVTLLPFWLGEGTPAPTAAQARAVQQTPVVALPEGSVVPVVAAVDGPPAPAYTTPPPPPAGSAGALSSAQLASYLVAHSQYVSPLSRRSVLGNVTVDDVEQQTEPAAPAPGDAGR